MVDQVETLGGLLMECLEGAVAQMDPTIAPQEVCFRVGNEVPYDADLYFDMCCRGLAYVTLGDIWPSSASFPEQDIVRQASAVCFPPSWAVQWQVGIISCAPVGTDTSMPTCEQWTSSYLRMVANAQALRRTACCFRAAVRSHEDFRGMSIVIERQTQGSPQGGCVERLFTIAVQMPNCDCAGS